MDIGKKIQTMRENKGLTRYRLTQMTGISGHHIKGIENGTRQPAIDTLQRLIEAMGFTMAEFFNEGSENNTYLTERERILLENFRLMNPEKADSPTDSRFSGKVTFLRLTQSVESSEPVRQTNLKESLGGTTI